MSPISSGQSRAGRGWLGWTQADLADKAHVGLSTIRDFEADRRTPVHNNTEAIRRALEDGGAGEFLKATDGMAAPKQAAQGQAERNSVNQSPESVPGKRRGSGARESREKRSRHSSR